jgi:predicted CopG family antitoxin
MKIIMVGMVAFLLSVNIQAQKKNIKSEVKTNITTVKDSDGNKQVIQTKEVEEVQSITFKDADSKILNKDIKESPVNVTATTKITENGVTKLISIDRSAYYELEGMKYQVVSDKSGYTMIAPSGEKSAVLRKTSNNNYIYKAKDKTSYGYFTADGNLILEHYDEATDTVTITTYSVGK